jgi:UDP-glucose 4-epimerase
MMKNILITGASGFLGGYIEALMSQHKGYVVYSLLRNSSAQTGASDNRDIRYLSMADFCNGKVKFDETDVLVHLAFGRAHRGNEEISRSVAFTSRVLHAAKASGIKNFINVSSQEVYGESVLPPWNETMEPSPSTMYGLAKYASELLSNMLATSDISHHTSLRLAALLGKESSSRMVNKFVENAIARLSIKIVGGSQFFSQLDVRDAADAIVSLLGVEPKNWKRVYNLGHTRSYGILEIADIVAKVAVEMGLPKPQIEIRESDAKLFAEMDSSLFYGDTGWRPKYDMYDTVRSIFMYQLAGENSG